MGKRSISRRSFLAGTGPKAVAAAAVAATVAPLVAGAESAQGKPTQDKTGAQRLPLAALHKWEALGYGMFIHFGMSTYVGEEMPDGTAPASLYAPDKLDVDQWVSVARDAGMTYAVMCAKHVAGHCLWPSKHTDYTVANSANTTDVIEAFVAACAKRGVLPGFYYCSWDNHNRFGSVTPSDKHIEDPAYTTSVYQTFQTAQLTELLTQYGPFAEVWIDIPGVLGRGYRTFLYHYIASLQPETVIMMNSGISSGDTYDIEYAWPSDLIAIERYRPPASGHRPWRTIEGCEYYLPGEVCEPIGKEWFHVDGDLARHPAVLAREYQVCRERGVNLLLDVPPDKHGMIPKTSIKALHQMRKIAGI